MLDSSTSNNVDFSSIVFNFNMPSSSSKLVIKCYEIFSLENILEQYKDATLNNTKKILVYGEGVGCTTHDKNDIRFVFNELKELQLIEIDEEIDNQNPLREIYIQYASTELSFKYFGNIYLINGKYYKDISGKHFEPETEFQEVKEYNELKKINNSDLRFDEPGENRFYLNTEEYKGTQIENLPQSGYYEKGTILTFYVTEANAEKAYVYLNNDIVKNHKSAYYSRFYYFEMPDSNSELFVSRSKYAIDKVYAVDDVFETLEKEVCDGCFQIDFLDYETLEVISRSTDERDIEYNLNCFRNVNIRPLLGKDQENAMNEKPYFVVFSYYYAYYSPNAQGELIKELHARTLSYVVTSSTYVFSYSSDWGIFFVQDTENPKMPKIDYPNSL